MAYFQIMVGLRGCYMPDSSYVIQCRTRRELRAALESEAQAGSRNYGLSKRAISWAAAKAWRERGRQTQMAILPFGPDKGARRYSIEIAGATREEWKAHQDSPYC